MKTKTLQFIVVKYLEITTEQKRKKAHTCLMFAVSVED